MSRFRRWPWPCWRWVKSGGCMTCWILQRMIPGFCLIWNRCPSGFVILVLFPGDIDMFRATQQRQDKAQSAENGAPLSRTATPYWRCCVAPYGQAGKRSPAALRRLARTRHSLRGAPGAQPLPDPLNMSISPGKSTRGKAGSGEAGATS